MLNCAEVQAIADYLIKLDTYQHITQVKQQPICEVNGCKIYPAWEQISPASLTDPRKLASDQWV